MYICSHIQNMIFYKLATCISWTVFGGTIRGQHRQVSLYTHTHRLRGSCFHGSAVIIIRCVFRRNHGDITICTILNHKDKRQF
jgi:hypothetical protein